jgi:type I restriction enzyme M protein
VSGLDIEFNLKPVSKKVESMKKRENVGKIDSLVADCELVDKNKELEDLYSRLWTAADELRANSSLRSNQYSTPILGLLFLRYADHRFSVTTELLSEKFRNRNRSPQKMDYHAVGVIYLPEKTRYQYLLNLPEGENIGEILDSTMRIIESENEEIKDVLPKIYSTVGDDVLVNLLKLFHKLPTDLDRDLFGKIYEYFLGKFAMSEGQRGGEFFTPTSIVRLIVEILEPNKGRILDPACGSGGMFVQSAEFVKDHKNTPETAISIFGQEMARDTVKLCKMNLAIHGLTGEINEGNTYVHDTFDKLGYFDFVMANPPFNVNGVDKEVIKGDPRYPFGIPRPDNANYLWIQVFYSMLNESGRAGFVMANSAGDARHSEMEIRKQMIEKGDVDVVISVASNFFFTVTLPVTLWFLDKGKKMENKGTVLFIDARNHFNQIDRAHREFTEQQIEFLSNIVSLYRGEKPEFKKCSSVMISELFADHKYNDVPGLCKRSTIKEIEEQDWSLNPGRYVGVERSYEDDIDFKKKLDELNETLKILHKESNQLETQIMINISKILEE